MGHGLFLTRSRKHDLNGLRTLAASEQLDQLTEASPAEHIAGYVRTSCGLRPLIRPVASSGVEEVREGAIRRLVPESRSGRGEKRADPLGALAFSELTYDGKSRIE